MSNPAIEILVEAIEERSVPVIIGEGLRWLAPEDHAHRRDEWRTRIASMNGGSDPSRGLGVYGYPVGSGAASTMVLAELAAGPPGAGRWWQYWRKDGEGDGAWRVAHEGPAAFGEIHLEGLPRRMPPGGVDRYAP